MNIHICYINLDKRPDKNQHMINQFKAHNIINYERVSGIDGNTIKAIPSNIISKIGMENINIINKYNGIDLTYGSIGLAITYYNLFNKIYNDTDTNKYHLIFEDDVIIDKLFMYNLQQSISELPNDWDLFFPGVKSDANTLDLTNKTIYKLKITNTLWKPHFTVGMHSFLINPRKYHKIIDIIFPLDYQIDTVISMHYNIIKAYVRFPQICFASDDLSVFNKPMFKSDIQIEDFTNYKQKNYNLIIIIIIIISIFSIIIISKLYTSGSDPLKYRNLINLKLM